MGWTVPYDATSRKEIIRRRTKNEGVGKWRGTPAKWECKRHCYRGNRFSGVLWTVWHIVHAETGEVLAKFIGCDLLQYYNRDDAWGYKDMCESMGPHYFSCPLSYLDDVPMPDSEYAPEWRRGVREYHAKRNKKLVVGETYPAVKGLKVGSRKIVAVKVLSLRPLRGDAIFEDGGFPERVKFSKKHIDGTTPLVTDPAM
jgi:hypothetical protein